MVKKILEQIPSQKITTITATTIKQKMQQCGRQIQMKIHNHLQFRAHLTLKHINE